jgi:hypothetical protein
MGLFSEAFDFDHISLLIYGSYIIDINICFTIVLNGFKGRF